MTALITLKQVGTKEECDAWALKLMGHRNSREEPVLVDVQVGGVTARGFVAGYVCRDLYPGIISQRCETIITVQVEGA